MLELRGLSVRYGAVQALTEVSLRAEPGGITAILGANGAGKSSLLRAVSGIAPVAAGQVLVRVHAAGVNRPDVLMRQGKYAGSGDVTGLVPGLEIAGIVEECGPDAARWQPGDAVCALLAAGVALVATGSAWAKFFGFLALVMASVNIFGGFLVTQRMLGMYKKRETKK